MPRKSEVGSVKRAWLASAACCLSDGRSRGSWMDSAAAMTMTSSMQPSRPGFQHHPAQPWVDGQPGQLAADGGQLRRTCRPSLERAELEEEGQPVADPAPIRRVDEGKVLDLPGVAEAESGHLQQHGCQVGAGDLRVGEFGTGVEVLLRIQPDADAVLEPAAASGSLARGGLRDPLDRQPLHLRAVAVAGDARVARVDDVADSRHGQRGLRDVGRQDHAPPRMCRRRRGAARRWTAGRTAERLLASAPGCRLVLDPLERLGRVSDLAFAGAEHQNVAGAFPGQLADRLARWPAAGPAHPGRMSSSSGSRGR